MTQDIYTVLSIKVGVPQHQPDSSVLYDSIKGPGGVRSHGKHIPGRVQERPPNFGVRLKQLEQLPFIPKRRILQATTAQEDVPGCAKLSVSKTARMT